jgi:hypothetical protein
VAYLYFDESIRERGGFIIGALVVSEIDLTPAVNDEWRRLGLDPAVAEYKSSNLKRDSPTGVDQRSAMVWLLFQSKLALVVAPMHDRSHLGEHCASLISQLHNAAELGAGPHSLYLDQNIKLSQKSRETLVNRGYSLHTNSDSRKIAGIQVADHAAHALGGMLLEELGILKKMVRAGEESGYDADQLLELGFELWASLRYALIGRKGHVDGMSHLTDDPDSPYFAVDGVGLWIAPTCSKELSESAIARFGVNYLGCIH